MRKSETVFAVNASGFLRSTADVSEDQWFARADADYRDTLAPWLEIELGSGGWYEHATGHELPELDSHEEAAAA